MIIVEGPDGAGKTSLIKQLLERHEDLSVAPRVVSKDAEAMVDLQHWVNVNLSQGFQFKIFDRHRLISEPIYGPILRDKQEPGFTSFTWMAHSLRRFYRLNPIMIYCLPPLEVVMANIAEDDDNKVVQKRIESIYAAYIARAGIDYTNAPSLVYIWDYTRDDAPDEAGVEFFDHVINRARKRNR